jgi:hypothetical protein
MKKLFALLFVIAFAVGYQAQEASKQGPELSAEVTITPLQQLEIEKQILLIEKRQLELSIAQRNLNEAEQMGSLLLDRLYMVHGLKREDYLFNQSTSTPQGQPIPMRFVRKPKPPDELKPKGKESGQ